MGILPKIIWDKWPGIVGQIVARKYLPDPMMSVAATGDIRSDVSPLQMADFAALRNLDRWFKRIHFEGNGGGQGSESYALTAYYYAYLVKMPKAVKPIYLITGDEAFVPDLYASDLRDHFGGEHKNISAREVFTDLIEKFKGNVFLIHRRYTGATTREGWNNTSIVGQWTEVLGSERIIILPEDLAIGDLTLGVYALVSGARTLEQYLEDMRTRPLDLAEGVEYKPQSEKRIKQIGTALKDLDEWVRNRKPTRSKAKSTARVKELPNETSSSKKKPSTLKI